MIDYNKVRYLFSYDENTGKLFWKNPTGRNKNIIGTEAGSNTAIGYKRVKIFNKEYLAHRIVWLWYYGYLPENMIDHINRIKTDNRICNLREVSAVCNSRNRDINKRNTSGVQGVSWDKYIERWKVSIGINNKIKNIGTYKEYDEAVCMRLAVEQCIGWVTCCTDSTAEEYVKNNICKI